MKKGTSIYTLEDKLLDKVINEYCDYVSNPQNVHRQDFSNINMYTGEIIYNDGKGIIDMPLSTHTNIIGETVRERENLPKPQHQSTYNNFLFLLDNLYRHYLNTEPDANDEVWFLLSSEMLKKIDEYYNYKIEILFILGILNRRQYDETRCEYTIIEPSMFKCIPCNLQEVLRKKEELRKAFEEKTTRDIVDIHGEEVLPFVDKYNQFIKRITIDTDGARACADAQEGERIRLYYHNIITKIHEGLINNVGSDKNGRWYHIGTSLPRNLKPFTNIQYTIDCKNSHPLLFNLIILDYYLNNNVISINNKYNNIDKLYKIYYLINYFIYNYYSLYSFHYFGGNLCNYLKINNVKSDIIAKIEKIPYDVYTYMYHTMKGNFWEYFLEYFKDDPALANFEVEERRGKIKKIVFGKVFYGGQTRIYKSDDNRRWIEAFWCKYPHVWQIITLCKQTLREEVKGTEEEGKKVLSWLLMRLEGRIFTNILMKLFNKRGLVVISIHDAIVVLKDNKIGEEKIKEIMVKEYARYGLIPTLSTDYFENKYVEQSVEQK